ncbi:CidA/LrgA family protein [Virgibacillus sp. W0430]|uniref:CidA/LrgA family protein n=1 Tax=Virgibacillus sp. W0430 TaxID=3391580 RepID=UPI003F46C4BB
MSIHVCLFYFIYLLGNWIQFTFHLVVPGSVIGMIILFLLLLTKGIRVSWIQEGATFMMNNLAFFFIPATVGMMNYFHLFSGKGIMLVIIVFISTIFVMTASSLSSQWLAKEEHRWFT